MSVALLRFRVFLDHGGRVVGLELPVQVGKPRRGAVEALAGQDVR